MTQDTWEPETKSGTETPCPSLHPVQGNVGRWEPGSWPVGPLVGYGVKGPYGDKRETEQGQDPL